MPQVVSQIDEIENAMPPFSPRAARLSHVALLLLATLAALSGQAEPVRPGPNATVDAFVDMGATRRQIFLANADQPIEWLEIPRQLQLPKGKRIDVLPGDTLQTVADRGRTTIDHLVELNELHRVTLDPSFVITVPNRPLPIPPRIWSVAPPVAIPPPLEASDAARRMRLLLAEGQWTIAWDESGLYSVRNDDGLEVALVERIGKGVHIRPAGSMIRVIQSAPASWLAPRLELADACRKAPEAARALARLWPSSPGTALSLVSKAEPRTAAVFGEAFVDAPEKAQALLETLGRDGRIRVAALLGDERVAANWKKLNIQQLREVGSWISRQKPSYLSFATDSDRTQLARVLVNPAEFKVVARGSSTANLWSTVRPPHSTDFEIETARLVERYRGTPRAPKTFFEFLDTIRLEDIHVVP